jgi:N utilization substance protein A
MEVPEIYDETVVIKSAVREPGDRAKIAVASNEKDVDPVGACVGMKGSRVQSIIKELRGEKIDIIEWSDEPSVFAANALSPAKVSQVRITDINDRQMEVIVGEDQLSLAIGKKGQNVRLATRLVGWDIKIVSEEILKKEIARQMGRMMASGEAVPITSLEGVNANQADALEAKGITDVEKLAATSVDDLVDALDVSLDEAERILASASAIVAAKEEQQGGQASGSGEDNSSEISEEAGPPTTDDSAVGEPEPATEADTSLDENAEVNGDENTAAGETVSDAEEEQIAQDADVNEEQS